MSAETVAACPNCGSTMLYRGPRVLARGVYGPDLLPGLKGGFLGPRMNVVVCADCGLARFFVEAKYRAKLPQAKKWSQME